MADSPWTIELRHLLDDIVGSRTGPALAALRLLREVYLPWLERRLVRRARQEGMSWTGIGRLLGRSRQAIQQRHDVGAHVSDGLAPVLPAWHDEREGAARYELILQLRREREADAAAAEGGLVPW